jgi:hypothetical protein
MSDIPDNYVIFLADTVPGMDRKLSISPVLFEGMHHLKSASIPTF